MTLKIFLSTTLRRYIPGYDPAKGLKKEISQGTMVAEVCGQINVPTSDIKIILVDGRRREQNHPLVGDERVYLFPPIGGG